MYLSVATPLRKLYRVSNNSATGIPRASESAKAKSVAVPIPDARFDVPAPAWRLKIVFRDTLFE